MIETAGEMIVIGGMIGGMTGTVVTIVTDTLVKTEDAMGEDATIEDVTTAETVLCFDWSVLSFT